MNSIGDTPTPVNHSPQSKSSPPEKVTRKTSRYLKYEGGGMRPLMANAIHYLDKSVLRNIIAYDELSQRVVAKEGLPWNPVPHDWTDRDSIYLTCHIQEQADLHVNHQLVSSAVDAHARTNSFHPVREYLSALEWDGEPRLDTWLENYLGCQAGPAQTEKYLREVSRCTLISAVARAAKPGCKVDNCLILEGEQGTKKSSAVKILAGDWFTESTANLGTKDSMLEIQTWFVELSELDTMNGVEAGRLKAYLSCSTDRFRPPYGRYVVEVPRSCIFVGTVNHSDYLRDETGARRFWPVETGFIHLEWLEEDRDQLWAEAYSRYLSGETWWLDQTVQREDAAAAQAERYVGDPWDERVLTFAQNTVAAGAKGVFILNILQDGLSVPLDKCDRGNQMRVGKILKANGWRRKSSSNSQPGRSRWYFPPT